MLRDLIQGLRTEVVKSLSLVMGCSNITNFFLFLECEEGPSATKPYSKVMAGGPYFEFCSLLLFVNLVKPFSPLYCGLVQWISLLVSRNKLEYQGHVPGGQHKLLRFIASSL